MAKAMRKAALLCRNVRRLSTVASQGSFGLLARPLAGKVDASPKLLSSPVWCVESRGSGGAFVQSSAPARVGALRFMGFGTFNEEHTNAVVPEEEFEDEVNDDEHPSVAIEKASHELFRRSNSVVDYDASEEEEFKVKELGREKPGADIAREVWSAKEQDGTSVFSDESDKATSKG